MSLSQCGGCRTRTCRLPLLAVTMRRAFVELHRLDLELMSAIGPRAGDDRWHSHTLQGRALLPSRSLGAGAEAVGSVFSISMELTLSTIFVAVASLSKSLSTSLRTPSYAMSPDAQTQHAPRILNLHLRASATSILVPCSCCCSRAGRAVAALVDLSSLSKGLTMKEQPPTLCTRKATTSYSAP